MKTEHLRAIGSLISGTSVFQFVSIASVGGIIPTGLRNSVIADLKRRKEGLVFNLDSHGPANQAAYTEMLEKIDEILHVLTHKV